MSREVGEQEVPYFPICVSSTRSVYTTYSFTVPCPTGTPSVSGVSGPPLGNRSRIYRGTPRRDPTRSIRISTPYPTTRTSVTPEVHLWYQVGHRVDPLDVRPDGGELFG